MIEEVGYTERLKTISAKADTSQLIHLHHPALQQASRNLD